MPLKRDRWQYKRLSDSKSGCIAGLREEGWSYKRIGRHLGQSDMVVARNWEQWITEESGGPQNLRNTNEGEKYKSGNVYTKSATSIDLMLLTTFQASGGIKGNHSDTSVRHWYKKLISIKKPTADHIS